MDYQGIALTLTAAGIFGAGLKYFVNQSIDARTKRSGDGNSQHQHQRRTTAGEMDPAYWKMEMRDAMKDELADLVIPILNRQTTILERLAEQREDNCCRHCENYKEK